MLTDPILDAWLTAVDTATQRYPQLAIWFADRHALVAITDIVQGYAYEPGDALTELDGRDRDALVLASGTVEVLHTDEDGDETPIRQVQAPATLGAFGFAIGRRRTATTRALTPAIALTLTRQGLADVARQSPAVAIGLLRWLCLDLAAWLTQTRDRVDPWSREHGVAAPARTFAVYPPGRYAIAPDSERAREAQAHIPELTGFQGADSRAIVDAIGEGLHLVGVDAGAAITSHGDQDRSLLVLIKGRASVRNTDGAVLASFDGGSSLTSELWVGELAFLTGAPRNGTVIADSDCTLLEIPPDALMPLVHRDPQLVFRLHVSLLRTICWRLHEEDLDRARTAQILAGDLDAWLDS